MPSDTNRKALRAALPLLSFGLALLAVSELVPAVLSIGSLAEQLGGLGFTWAAKLLGLAGAAVFGVGLFWLARARIAGRFSLWLASSVLVWAAELVLRLFALPPASGQFIALRALFVGTGAYCLCAGMPWLLDQGASTTRLRTWFATRRLFGLQLLLYLGVPLVAWLQERPASEGPLNLVTRLPFGIALAWIVLAGPLVHLFLSLRRTRSWVSRPRSLEDVLREGG